MTLPLDRPITSMTELKNPQISPQLVNFKPAKKSFTILSSKQKRKTCMFESHRFTVPAMHELLPGKFDTDADGNPIPGSLVIEDIYSYDPRIHADIMTLDSERAVKHILGIKELPDGSAAALTSERAQDGLSLLPRHATKEMWTAVMKEGEWRAFLKEAERADDFIQAVEHRNALLREAGMQPIPGGPRYERARQIRIQYNKIVKKEQEEALAPYRQEEEQASAMAELEFLAYMKTMVSDLVEKQSKSKPDVNKVQLFEELMADPDVKKHVRSMYKFRRKGHLPEDAQVESRPRKRRKPAEEETLENTLDEQDQNEQELEAADSEGGGGEGVDDPEPPAFTPPNPDDPTTGADPDIFSGGEPR